MKHEVDYLFSTYLEIRLVIDPSKEIEYSQAEGEEEAAKAKRQRAVRGLGISKNERSLIPCYV